MLLSLGSAAHDTVQLLISHLHACGSALQGPWSITDTRALVLYLAHAFAVVYISEVALYMRCAVLKTR